MVLWLLYPKIARRCSNCLGETQSYFGKCFKNVPTFDAWIWYSKKASITLIINTVLWLITSPPLFSGPCSSKKDWKSSDIKQILPFQRNNQRRIGMNWNAANKVNELFKVRDFTHMQQQQMATLHIMPRPVVGDARVCVCAIHGWQLRNT